jgi:hypothetical protein
MGTPNTWRECGLGSAALERAELMVGKFANRIRTVPFQSIRSSGTRRLTRSGGWRERRLALGRSAPSPNINSVRSIAVELRRPSFRVFEFKVGIRL